MNGSNKTQFGKISLLKYGTIYKSNTDEDVSEWVTLAKRMKPSPENLSTIKHAMDRTYTHRRIWITTQSSNMG